jgi:putative ABC transport system permease protein
MKFFLLILKNLRRNKIRTSLTCLAVMVLVFVVTMIWTIVYFLENMKQEKSGNMRGIVTERWQMNSQMPLTFKDPLSRGAARNPGDKTPKDSMAWQFYLGTIDPEKKTQEGIVFLVAMDVRKLPKKVVKDGKKIVTQGIIDDLDPMDEELVEKLANTRKGCILGQARLKNLKKRVGDTFKVTAFEYSGIDLEFEIVGELPKGRWDDNGFMNEEYLNEAINAYKGPGGAKHPLDQRRLNMMWVEAREKEDFGALADQINNSPAFAERPVKCESFASLITNFLDSWQGFIWFIEWVLVPGSMFSMILLIANAISLNVRERTKEMAVLKVLGFRPGQLLLLVLGEALLLGLISGLVASCIIYFGANAYSGGIRIGDSEPFPVPGWAILWGAAAGGFAALAGSVLPAWTARTIKASEVFARTT